MMRKIFIALCALFCGVAHAGPIANIEYIHTLIKQRHGIDIPYSPELKTPRAAANMKYLLSVIDIANTKINGAQFTHYGENEAYATLNAADTTTTIEAVDNLITEIEYPFHFTPAVESNEYMFQIGAQGTFYVDWGDGVRERIVKTDTNKQSISHTYETAAKNYTIGLGGRATAYSNSATTAAIIFDNNASRLSAIDGCLGCIFSTIGDGTQPRFCRTFYDNTNLTGSIPANLFAGISGVPVTYMFIATFQNCSGLTGQIPLGLFAEISGEPTRSMFQSTFSGCTGLTGPIPDGLFAGINGAPAESMFYETFFYCPGLTSIPADLFGNISGDMAPASFYQMFWGDKGLTGPSARINGKYLYEIWPEESFLRTYYGCSGLSDRGNWK